MRTTYVYKQGNNAQSQRVIPPQNITQLQETKATTSSVSLVDTYLLVKAIANNIQRDMMDNLECKIYQNTDTENPRVEPKQVKPRVQEPRRPSVSEPPKKNNKIPIIVASVLALLTVVVVCVGYYMVTNKNLASSVEDLEASVSRLYTSADKTDVLDDLSQSDLEDYFKNATDLKNKGKDVSSLIDELTTISYFIQDKKKLNDFNDANFDLTTVGLTGEIESIVENTKNYTVSSLVVTISDKASIISTQYETYVNLKLEMQGITDALTFDENVYAKKIEQIVHNPNKEELQGIYNILLADKEATKAKNKLDKAKNKKDLEKAQKDLDKAKKQQEETQKKLKELQEKLQSEINYKDSTSEDDSTEKQSSEKEESSDSQE